MKKSLWLTHMPLASVYVCIYTSISINCATNTNTIKQTPTTPIHSLKPRWKFILCVKIRSFRFLIHSVLLYLYLCVWYFSLSGSCGPLWFDDGWMEKWNNVKHSLWLLHTKWNVRKKNWIRMHAVAVVY